MARNGSLTPFRPTPMPCSKHPLAMAATTTVATVVTSMPALGFKPAAEAVLQLAIAANGHLNDTAPWSRMKQPGQETEVGDDLYAVLEATRIVGLLLNPLCRNWRNDPGVLGTTINPDGWTEQLNWGGLVSEWLFPNHLR